MELGNVEIKGGEISFTSKWVRVRQFPLSEISAADRGSIQLFPKSNRSNYTR